jgi:ABC-type nitrate/sulfonate/bicarbonate transport system substrate-binding protein
MIAELRPVAPALMNEPIRLKSVCPRMRRTARNTCLAACAILLLAHWPALGDDALSVVRDGKTPPLMNALNLIAEGAGFYKEERLKVTNVASDGPVDARRICSSGQGDICPVGIEPLAAPPAAGVQLKMFLSRMSKFGYVIAVPEDSPIRTPADLKGKKIGGHSATGTSAVFAIQSTLLASGLKPGDFELVTTGMNEEAVGALASGKVAALGMPFYELLPFIVGGTKLRIFRHPTLGEVPNSGYAAAPSVIADKGDALRRFSRAIVKASLLVRYNPAVAARALLTGDGNPFNDADLQRKTAELAAWEDDLPAADPANKRIGAIPIAGMQAYIQLMADAGVIKAAIPASRIVTDEFIEFANNFDHNAVRRMANAAAAK